MYKFKKYEKVTVAAIVLLGRNVRWFLFSHGQIFRVFRGGYPEKAGGAEWMLGSEEILNWAVINIL